MAVAAVELLVAFGLAVGVGLGLIGWELWGTRRVPAGTICVGVMGGAAVGAAVAGSPGATVGGLVGGALGAWFGRAKD